MASRRDQLQSYQFLVQRVVSALVLREADPAQTPFRRLAGATMVSVMVGVISLAGIGVFGIIRPSGKQSWRSGDRVIVERETGATFYFRRNQRDPSDPGVLHPMANFASAAIVVGTSKTVLVSQNSLADVARGRMLGIPGAPDALPPVKRLLPAPWVLCSVKEDNLSGQLEDRTILLLTGGPPPGGTALGDAGLLVTDAATGKLWFVYDGLKHEVVDDTTAVRTALRRQNSTEADGAWLEGLPTGLDLGPSRLEGRGALSAAVPRAGARVGQVFRSETESGGRTYYVATRSALRPVTELQAEILVAASATAAAYPGRVPDYLPLSTAASASARIEGELPTGDLQPPGTVPTMAEVPNASSLCVPFRTFGDDAPTVLYNAQVQLPRETVDTSERTVLGTQLADRVVVREGWGALVESMPTPTATRGTLMLVTDNGLRYPIDSLQTAGALGYPGPPLRLPDDLVTRVPAGPGLSAQGALQVVE